MRFFDFKKGSTRMAFLIGPIAVKVPKPNLWKSFLRGMLANLDEVLWYKSSPKEWQQRMAPAYFQILGGLVLFSRRATPLTEAEYADIDLSLFEPLPMDSKIINFGTINGKVVLVDYADSRYFCSQCEQILKRKSNSK